MNAQTPAGREHSLSDVIQVPVARPRAACLEPLHQELDLAEEKASAVPRLLHVSAHRGADTLYALGSGPLPALFSLGSGACVLTGVTCVPGAGV